MWALMGWLWAADFETVAIARDLVADLVVARLVGAAAPYAPVPAPPPEEPRRGRPAV